MILCWIIMDIINDMECILEVLQTKVGNILIEAVLMINYDNS